MVSWALLLFVAYTIFLVLGQLRSNLTARRLARLPWAEVVPLLDPVRMKGITSMAIDVDPEATTASVEDLWNTVGGLEGLRRMRANADVLLALVCYAEAQGTSQDATVHELRKQGLRLKRAALVCRLSILTGSGGRGATWYLRIAVTSYYEIVHLVLGVYQRNHIARYPVLLAACNV